MKLSIHKQSTRFLIALLVFLAVLLVAAPHLFGGETPLIVSVMFKPAEIIAASVSPFISRENIGTAENPVYEMSNLDLLVGLVSIFFNALLYPFGAYLLLSLASKILKRKTSAPGDSNFN